MNHCIIMANLKENMFENELSPNHYNQNFELDYFKKLQSVQGPKYILSISATPINKDKSITQLYNYIK
ncbi:hypothetical protein MegaChil _gp0078 [Megavirus chiliensis]|nr:hypothetical protein MegaChil _gp0078 [Megavirus chiliensis]